MRQILPELIENIKNSYYAAEPGIADKVIKKMEDLSKYDKPYVLRYLSMRKVETTNEFNIFAEVWRTIERSVIYPFEVGETIKFNKRKRVITSIDLVDRTVITENGDILPLVSLVKCEQEDSKEDEQL